MKLSKLATLVLTLAAAGAVYAQSPTMTANVPFNFVISGQTMPAGKYTINDLGSAHTVAIRQADAKAAAVAITSNVEQPGPGGPTPMVFHRYGNRYFLSQVWVAGSYRCTFAPSRIERELSARRNDPGESVVVALR
jgi:hypothetical protein